MRSQIKYTFVPLHCTERPTIGAARRLQPQSPILSDKTTEIMLLHRETGSLSCSDMNLPLSLAWIDKRGGGDDRTLTALNDAIRKTGLDGWMWSSYWTENVWGYQKMVLINLLRIVAVSWMIRVLNKQRTYIKAKQIPSSSPSLGIRNDLQYKVNNNGCCCWKITATRKHS